MKKIIFTFVLVLVCLCSCNNNKYDFVNEPFTVEYCYKVNTDFTIDNGLITVKYDGNDFITYHYNIYPKNINDYSKPPYKIFPEDSITDEIEHKIEYDTVYVFSDTLKDVRITRDEDHIIAYKQTEDGHYIKFLDGYFGKE